MIEPWHWLVLGIVLITLELFLPSFVAFFFGVAAIIISVLAWLIPMPMLGEVIAWLILSVACCLLWFRFVQPTIKNRTKSGLGGSVIIGEIGMIVEVPTADRLGRVRFNTPKLGASEWDCRVLDEQGLAVGERVLVVNIVGNELVVAKK